MREIKNMVEIQERNPVMETNEQWDEFFSKREAFLKVKLTDKQKEGWKRGTIKEAEKALELRQDLQKFYDNGAYSKKLRERLEHYLKPEYENLEYELNNNGCCNLIEYLEDEVDKHDNYWLKKILEDIKGGYYGDWCRT